MRTISSAELSGLIKSLGQLPSASDISDFNGDRRISFPEFVTLMAKKMKSINIEVKETFEMFDTDHNGFVSAVELKTVLNQLGEVISEQEAENMIKKADIDGDGQINIDEFNQMMFPQMNGQAK
jgi:Ca2+-binding EF-hand superfamily protein